jgi:hypothetical protein
MLAGKTKPKPKPKSCCIILSMSHPLFSPASLLVTHLLVLTNFAPVYPCIYFPSTVFIIIAVFHWGGKNILL